MQPWNNSEYPHDESAQFDTDWYARIDLQRLARACAVLAIIAVAGFMTGVWWERSGTEKDEAIASPVIVVPAPAAKAAGDLPLPDTRFLPLAENEEKPVPPKLDKPRRPAATPRTKSRTQAMKPQQPTGAEKAGTPAASDPVIASTPPPNLSVEKDSTPDEPQQTAVTRAARMQMLVELLEEKQILMEKKLELQKELEILELFIHPDSLAANKSVKVTAKSGS